MECLFCKIANGDILANILYQDEQVVCFDDISPKAPHHKLIIPRKHIATINDIGAEDQALIGHMVTTGAAMAKQLNIAEPGYRLVFNCNSDGGQLVYHIHLHLLGGRQMTWPPG
ncbi:MAG: histidine triad nucleotide-binding protein [Gammaproteobacteria bacterium]